MQPLTPRQIQQVFDKLGLSDEQSRAKFRRLAEPSGLDELSRCFIRLDNTSLPSPEEHDHAKLASA